MLIIEAVRVDEFPKGNGPKAKSLGKTFKGSLWKGEPAKENKGWSER